MAGRWTSARVAAAQADYSASCAQAEAAVRVAVAALSARLADEMPTLCHAAHWCKEFTFIGSSRSHLCISVLVSPSPAPIFFFLTVIVLFVIRARYFHPRFFLNT